MREMASPAEQVTRVATLLGRAVLRWKRENEQSSEISKIVSNSLPERLEFSPVSSLSVTGQNDKATGLEETGSQSEMKSTNHVRGTTNKDRSLDRRSGLAACEQANRRRCGGAAVWMYEFGNEVAFLIRFGGSLKRDEVMDNDMCRPDIRRPVGYDLVVYNIETGELRIRADLVSERRFYCRLFSEQLFADPEFFEHGETFNLDVIYRLGEDIQSPRMVFGIKRVTLVEIQEILLGEKTLHITFKSEAIFDALREHNKRLVPNGRLLSAKFRIILEDVGEVIATVCSGNKIRFSRQLGIPQWVRTTQLSSRWAK